MAPAADAGRLAWETYKNELAAHEALVAAQKAKIVPPNPAPLFICGSIEPEPSCKCGHTAELLCDHPMGRGNTCDLPLCWCCGKHLGEDLDLCQIHFAEFVKRIGAQRINPWPPKRMR